MEGESLQPDLEGAVCAVATCLNMADVVGHATIRVPSYLGYPASQEQPVIEFVLCVDHGHRLRTGMENTLVAFDSGV